MNQVKFVSTIGILLMLISSCDVKNKIKIGEGFVNVKGGKIWYKVIGKGDKTPLLLLHGGPAYPSYYFNPFMELSQERPIIIFDQLGCGRSDRITDTTLMTVNNHLDQINQLVKTLDIKNFYLYGHSWGAALATEYYLKYSDGIKGLILASPYLSTKQWAKDIDTLVTTLPDSVQLIINNNKKGIAQDSLKLSTALNKFFNTFYTRKQPVSADLDSANSQVGVAVYQYMWGTNEFLATGTLKGYDTIGNLNKIKVPTLYITGEFDPALPTTVKYYQTLTPGSRMKVINQAGHMTMHDNAEEDKKTITNFLTELDKIK